jgi:hypothetical protein
MISAPFLSAASPEEDFLTTLASHLAGAGLGTFSHTKRSGEGGGYVYELRFPAGGDAAMVIDMPFARMLFKDIGIRATLLGPEDTFTITESLITPILKDSKRLVESFLKNAKLSQAPTHDI